MDLPSSVILYHLIVVVFKIFFFSVNKPKSDCLEILQRLIIIEGRNFELKKFPISSANSHRPVLDICISFHSF